jgi:hypothetical protein
MVDHFIAGWNECLEGARRLKGIGIGRLEDWKIERLEDWKIEKLSL